MDRTTKRSQRSKQKTDNFFSIRGDETYKYKW